MSKDGPHPQIRPVGADRKVNIMLYGHPGFGKTSFIGTGPDKTLIIKPPTETLDPIRRANPNMSEWVVTGWGEMFEALEYLRDSQGKDFDWVWLDSISAFQETGLDDIWEQTVARKPSRAEYGLDKSEYGINMFRLGQWIRHIVGSGYFNFGVTAYPAVLSNPDFDEENPDSPSEILMPWIQGKSMAVKVCGYCNMVGYLRLVGKNRRRVIYFEPNELYYAKNQLADIPKGRLVDPTIPKLMNIVNQNPTTTKKRRTA